MATFAVSITKATGWRGGYQPFSNVYHYNTAIGQTFDDVGLVQHLVDAEKAICSFDVDFVEARTWGPTGEGQAASQMREIIELSGNGNHSWAEPLYKELCFLFVWPLGRYGARNRPQYLRKWMHTMGAPTLPGAQLNGGQALNTGLADLNSYISSVRFAGGPTTDPDYSLATAKGREPIEDGHYYPYIEHHQFGDQWR